jgi:hypothetical protein
MTDKYIVYDQNKTGLSSIKISLIFEKIVAFFIIFAHCLYINILHYRSLQKKLVFSWYLALFSIFFWWCLIFIKHGAVLLSDLKLRFLLNDFWHTGINHAVGFPYSFSESGRAMKEMFKIFC